MPRKTRYDKQYATTTDRVRAWRERKGIKGTSGKKQYKWRGFIGWDGEGRDVNGEHQYTLLANSKGDYIFNPNGLSSWDCFDFMLDQHSKHQGVNVGFGFNYDVNMMLRDLPEETLRAINDSEEGHVTHNGRHYWIKHRGRKFFHISRSVGLRMWKPTYYKDGSPKITESGSPKYVRDIESSVQVWDVLGFFQTTFVKALREYFTSEELPGLDLIQVMKERRSEFSEDSDDDVLVYCQLECEYLARLMERLRGYLLDCDIRNTNWDGTGAIASYVMRRRNVREYMANTDPRTATPVATAYSGGRIEATCVGSALGTFYDYDLNSAYPSIQRDLPCLRHSEWIHTKGKPISELYLARVAFRFSRRHRWYPLWVRTANGSIRYPSVGEGWYWQDEVIAAKAFLEKSKVTLGNEPLNGPPRYEGQRMAYEEVKVKEYWNLVTHCDHKPFSFLGEQYEQRQRFKAEGNGAQKALKLSINSCYGKTMQQVGSKVVDGVWQPPPTFQLEWGGMITSACRAKLVQAALTTSENAIIYFATDGILTTEPLDVPMGKDLNTWEIKAVYEECVNVAPGCYWLRKGSDWFTATRGFEDAGSGRPTAVFEAWGRGMRSMFVRPQRFNTLRSSLHTKVSPKWRTWTTQERIIGLVGESAKRRPLPQGFDTRTLSDRLVPLRTMENDSNDISLPFTVDYWRTQEGYERSLELEENDLLNELE